MPSLNTAALSPSIPEETNSKLSLQRLIVLLGPTAVGKSELAIQLAEQLNGEIISADSRLFYRGMDIGTAKPSSVDRQRIPHHLIDVANTDQTWSLGVFQQQARRAIQDVNDRGKLPFLVGGTGQYIWAVVEGWQVPPVQPDPHLRDALLHWADEIGPGELHHRLEIIDPSGAALIDPTNLRRTIRALEVSLSSGVRFSEQRRRGVSPYNTLLVGLTRPRSELYQRIDERIQTMLSQGFVEEVRSLLAQGFSPNLPTLSAIGYGEIVSYLQGRSSLEEAVTQMKRRSRIFVRRQANWFKTSNAEIHWFQAGPDTAAQIGSLIQGWLGSQADLM